MLAIGLMPKYRMEWGNQGKGKAVCNSLNSAGGMEILSAVDLVGLTSRPEMLPKLSSSLRRLKVEVSSDVLKRTSSANKPNLWWWLLISSPRMLGFWQFSCARGSIVG